MWNLMSGVSEDQVTGEVRYPWGKNPVGRLSDEESGRVFAQLMNPDRRAVGGISNRVAAAAIADACAMTCVKCSLDSTRTSALSMSMHLPEP
jgi:hypothetical protein